MESLISVLHFTSKILIPKYPHTLLPFLSSLYVVHQQNNKRNQLKLRMFFVPDDLFLKLFPSDLKGLLLGDITSCILISFNTAKALNIPDFSWLILKKFNTGNNDLNTMLDIDPLNATDPYFLQAVAVPEMDDFVLIASDTTCHNIKQTLFTLNEQKSDVTLDEVSVLTTSYVDQIGFAPYMAKHVTLSLLESPLDISDQVIDAVLGTYFDNPHFLHLGDVFSVDVLKYAPEVYYTIGNQNIKMLYFKVAKIKGESYNNILLENVKSGYYVLKNYTKISQQVNVQSYMPCSSGYCLEGVESVTGKNYPLYFLSYCPSGLDQYFRELVDSLNPFIQNISELKLQVHPIFLIHGPRGVGKQEVVKSAAKVLGLHIWNVDCLELQSTSSGQAEGKLNLIFTKVHKFSPCILLLRNIEVLCKDKDGHEDSRVISSFQGYLSKMFEKKEEFPVLIVATSNTKNEASPVIVPALARVFLHVIQIEAPSEGERAAMFDWIIKGSNVKLGADVSLDKLASRSSGFLFADLQTVVSQALRYCHQRLKAMKGHAEDINTLNVVLDISDFEEALEVMSSAYSDAIGAPKIPAVTWNDVGGLTDLKSEIMRTIMLPIRYPEMVASGLRRSGILLFGPPGTGKTLLAKAVATECNLNFLSVKGPELLNMYVGQSEENVREVFARARAASPCIIFFDELDSLAPNRGRSGDSAGVMDRVVSQLLAEMDGLQKSTHLFVIGATNRPDLIDPALLRPGRFDKLLYVGVCGDKNTQLAVLTALTRKFHFRDGVSLEDFVASFPSNLTGADLYSVCANAWLNAVRTKIQQGAAEGSSETVEVGPEHFEAAVENLVASVSEKDLNYFRKLHQELGVPLPSSL